MHDEVSGALTDVDERLAAWKEKQQSPPPPTEILVTRWTPNVEITGKSIIEDFISSPSPMKEENTYTIRFNLLCKDADKNTKQTLTIILTPSKTTTKVNENSTGIFSRSPIASVWWDSNFSKTSGGCCRRMTFTSDEFTIKSWWASGNIDFPNIMTIALDFDLSYAK